MMSVVDRSERRGTPPELLTSPASQHRPVQQVDIYDTTLRDGTQGESVSVSVDGKLAIARRLGEFGMTYIEGGWPGSNPKDAEFFDRAKTELPSSTWDRVVAFGSTRRKFKACSEDSQIAMLLESQAKTICIVGKSWDLHVDHILEVPREENLAMVAESVAYLKEAGREVMLDLEHFFDGYKANPPYALEVCRAAVEAGVDALVMCDTNGGSLPWEIRIAVEAVKLAFPEVRLGIHCHNDQELAVANSLEAIRAGASIVQGTVNGVGERTGNANLVTLIPCLQMKMGYQGVGERLKDLTKLSRFVDEMMNRMPNPAQPFVGSSAFAHKGGIHVSAVAKIPLSYQHIEPEDVGNSKRVLVSELAGRSNIISKVREFGLCESDQECELWDDKSAEVLTKIKDLEKLGYTFEGAEASINLMLRRSVEDYSSPFSILDYSCQISDSQINSHTSQGTSRVDTLSGCSRATVKLQMMNSQGLPITKLEVAEGKGPVDALSFALRRALEPDFPVLREVELSDYKVRILDNEKATGATTRVMIEFKQTCQLSGHHESWTTVGVDANIISASFIALTDGLEYALLRGNIC